MTLENIIFELSVIIVGAALLGTLFLHARQPIIIAYIAIGIIVGPYGLALIPRPEYIEHISHIGVMLLLFLIGLNLQPTKLVKFFKKTFFITFATSTLFGIISTGFGLLLRFNLHSSLLLGASMMFSSTVVGLKLIPTTTLHHKRTGELMTSVLLLQDMLAILTILLIAGEKTNNMLTTFSLLTGKLILLCSLAFAGVRFLMIPLLTKFDVIQEYTFLATLAWCLLLAEIAHLFGLSYDMGAFVAGLSIGSCKVAIAIAEHLKPLREFFLILFFFAIGSKLNLHINPRILIASIIFGIVLVPVKALFFRIALRKIKEPPELTRELAVRLAQSGEFSLLVAFSGLSAGLITEESGMVIQIVTIVTIITSTYWVVHEYPTPISKSHGRHD